MTQSHHTPVVVKLLSPPRRSTQLATANQKKQLELKDEAMPVRMPGRVSDLILNYSGGDFIYPTQATLHKSQDTSPNSQNTSQNSQKTSQKSQGTLQKFRLCDKPYSFFKNIYDAVALVGKYLLCGDQKSTEHALDIIRKCPKLLRYYGIATDPLGRQVNGTLLQMAAMAGDFNLCDGTLKESELGLVERMILIGELSHQEIVSQLAILASKAAQEENERRNDRYLKALINFANTITKINPTHNLATFKIYCSSSIKRFESDLLQEAKEVITGGFIFDPQILTDAKEWFDENKLSFCEFHEIVFWAIGFGKLQAQLSSRDAHVTTASMAALITKKTIPARTLVHAHGFPYFHVKSGLGNEFYLSYEGEQCDDRYGMDHPSVKGESLLVNFSRIKNRSIAKLIEPQSVHAKFIEPHVKR